MKNIYKIVILFVIAALMVALGAGVLFHAFEQIEKEAESRKHVNLVLSSAEGLLSAVRDAETGQRGYSLTGDMAFLEPYLAVCGNIESRLKELRKITTIAAAGEHLEALIPLVKAKMASLAGLIELRRNNDMAAVISTIKSGHGKELMDSIRSEINSFNKIEQEALIQHEEKFKSDMHYLFAVLFLASLFSMLFALSFAYLIYRETQHRLKNLVHMETQRSLEIHQEANIKLESAKNIAEKANHAKSDFLSSMSHELRTPLNAIIGFAQLMESDVPPPNKEQKNSIDQILKAGWHLLKLINEILDLSKIESGNLPLSLEPVSLSEIITECRNMVEKQAQQRGINMIFPKFDKIYFVKADRTRLNQVLINLFSNAIKYNSTRGTVEVKYEIIRPGRMRLSVIDSGAGLSPEKIAQLFQPFNRIGQETIGPEGTGIGLVIAKKLVELMEGAIGVESIVGTGSTFWFEMGLVAEQQLEPQDHKTGESAKPDVINGSRQRTMLYIEDNLANMNLIEQIVARMPNVRMCSSMSGNGGIEIALAQMPDLILLDINLPDMNGFEALKILKANKFTMHIPVIAISANAMVHDIEKGRKAGFFNYLTKPIILNEFTAVIKAALESETQRTEPDK